MRTAASSRAGWLDDFPKISARGLRHCVELGGFLNTSLTKFLMACRVLCTPPAGFEKEACLAWNGEKV